jgi:DMSO/TMAO reductase YedYZ molybdopterin-dependent catalytic subunit
MNAPLSRRNLIMAGIVTAAGVSGVGLSGRWLANNALIPPDGGSFLGAGETLTYSAQRLLTSGQSLAREFPRSRISKVAPVNGWAPRDANYRSMLASGFRDWRLTIEGLVARPLSFSLDQLKQLPAESHTILHSCEEGWSYNAEWTGVRLSMVLQLVQTRSEARYLVFMPFPNPKQDTLAVRTLWDSIDMADALHPQTLLAYGMNGENLPADHGAPVRLRMSRQLGYKNTKFLTRIIVTDSMTKFGTRVGARPGTWYGGI